MKKFTLILVTLFSVSAFGQNQIDLPIDWEGSTTNYTVQDFGGNASMLVADPANASNTVLQSIKSNTAQLWAGTSLCDTSGLATPIPFAPNANSITVLVYSPDAGIPVRLKAEDNADPTKSVETEAVTTVANAWDTLVFDFSNEVSGTAPINYTYSYTKLSIFYNFGTDGANAGTKTYYCDEIFFGGNAPQPTTYNVTFQVDMNEFSGSFTTPEVNGLFNGWCGNCSAMSDADMDGIWDITVQIMDDSTEYKFSFDNWAGQESLAPGSPCTKTTGQNTNRFIVLTGDTVLPPVCWESCSACTGTPSTADVTFKVDLSEYTGSYTNVNLNGTFNNWCGSCATMTSPNNDGKYELTVTVPTMDTIEYKFTLDGWTTQETLTDGSVCTKTTVDSSGTFVNRMLVVSADSTLGEVCWESCDACGTVGIEENEFISNFSIAPNPSNGLIMVNGDLNSVEEYTVTVLNLAGSIVYTQTSVNSTIKETIDLSNFSNGVYILNITSTDFVISERIMITE